MNFPSINIQGNIISSEIIEKIRNEDVKYQLATDFKLDKKNSVRDEIGVAWAAIRTHWTAFKIRAERLAEGESGVTATRNSWMVPFFQELGYSLQFKPSAEQIHLKSYHISHRASNLNDFPIHIMGINDDLDKRRENGGPRLSPHALMQEFLNNTDHTYALVSNGRYLRLLRDATRLVRLSYLEFDLEKMMEEELYADFAILFRLLHATRVPQHPENVEESFIEYYHQESLASGSRIREKLSEAVENSIKLLANGFLSHPTNSLLRETIQQGKLTPENYYLIQLRLIYRFLFLIVTEERNLVYLDTKDKEVQRKRKIYYDFYSIERLRKLATRLHFVDGRKHDLWEGLKSTFLLFERSNVGEKLDIKPLGSGLFSPSALGMLPDLKINNEILLKVIRHLTLFENDQHNWVRVNYSDLDVEEFGSVYEGLLEYDALFTELNGQPVFSFVEGKGRSSSGSHYTPEELVKPLIKHSLEYIIENKLKEKNREEALLSIKVCDVACGSGHILLSAARRIATELARVRSNEDQPTPPVLRHALRDVIKHCIYGVDKNPLAVELCKVALWLESHNPGEPLGFLDHHIKCGDAIVGLGHKEELDEGIADEAFKTLPNDDKAIAKTYRDQNVKERKSRAARAIQLKADFEKTTISSVQEAMAEHKTFNQLPERTPDEIERKAKAYRKFIDGKGVTFLKSMADTQVAQFFIPKTESNKDCLITDNDFRLMLAGYKGWPSTKTAKAMTVATEEKFFHWFIEFPDVFNEGGFDCVLGNPPFLGGQKLSGFFGNNFLEYIKYAFRPIGAVDLVTYFFRRIFNIVKPGGFQSLISTNTIAQGSAREDGLDVICSQGGVINHAVRSMRWPGQAAVEVALVTIHKGEWKGDSILDNKKVDRITPYLDDSEVIGNPFPLKQNAGKSFIGSYVLGMGFVITPEQAQELILKDSRNKDVLFPYLNGEDLNNDPEQRPSRWVINFFDWSEEQARTYPDCFDIVERLVKPERQRWKRGTDGAEIKGTYALRKPLPQKWWVYSEKRPALYRTISKLDQVMALNRHSKHLLISPVKKDIVYSEATVVLALDSYHHYAVLSSSIHEAWAWKNSSTMKGDTLRYSASKAFETFPFPTTKTDELERLGQTLLAYRKFLMAKLHVGLTDIQNLLHNHKLVESDDLYQDILKYRSIHCDLDNAVLNIYGWADIQLKHNFYEVDYLSEKDRIRFTIHPDTRKEILKRLLTLNRQRNNEELDSNSGSKKTSKVEGIGLFSDESRA
jgi:hypothetical protein